MPENITTNHRATIDDVARYAGVSIATVSRVVNTTGQVAQSTRERVFDAIAALNYTPHAAAKGLASRRTNTLGLIVSEISGAFFQPMLKGIEAGVRAYGYDLLIHSTPRDHQGHASRYPLGEYNTDGLLIFTNSLNEAEITRLYQTGLPMVLLYRAPPPGLEIPTITFENKSGARKLVDYLIEQRGKRRIAFLRGPQENEDSYWRELGYRDSMAAHGITVDESLIGDGEFDEYIARRIVNEWIKQNLTLDAIFAGDDESALGAYAALNENQIRIPQDIAVVGFDDIPIARHLSPPLTTVQAPIEMTGRVAVDQLMRLIRDGAADLLTLLPTELVIRRSCGNKESATP